MGKVLTLEAAIHLREELRSRGESVVFTNGCFDLVHLGHVEYLGRAAAMGDCLIVGVNSDRSVRALKGPGRPVVQAAERCKIVAALACVDYVVPFDEPTPEQLIARLRPDVLAKGGDWPPAAIVGGSMVESWGGRVVSIASSVPERSSSRIIEQVRSVGGETVRAEPAVEAADLMRDALDELARTLERCRGGLLHDVTRAGACLASAFAAGGHVFLCGNGGDALAAQHIAVELVGRFREEALPLPAIALTTDVGVVTAVANDFGFDEVFARQVSALARSGDVLLVFSTSGTSRNVIRAVEEARHCGVTTIGLTGASGGRLSDLVDIPIEVPSDVVSHIQEAHLVLGHLICEFVQSRLRVPRTHESSASVPASRPH